MKDTHDYDNFYLEGTTIGISWTPPENDNTNDNDTDDTKVH